MLTKNEIKQLIVQYKARHRHITLAEIYAAADRAAERVASWPEWKRNL